jgi:WD40 repeat protein
MLVLMLMASQPGPETPGPRPRTLKGHSGSVMAVAFTPEGTTLASGSRDGTVKLWDPQTGALRQTLTGPKARIESLAYAPDGTILAGGSGWPEALIWLWEVDSPRE